MIDNISIKKETVAKGAQINDLLEVSEIEYGYAVEVLMGSALYRRFCFFKSNAEDLANKITHGIISPREIESSFTRI
jgi:hypothetical protein